MEKHTKGNALLPDLASKTDADVRAVAFFLSVLHHLGTVIGEKSVEALVRFAASEAASEAALQESLPLARLLEAHGRALGWKITVLKESPKETLARVEWGESEAGPAARAVAQGLVHGMHLGVTRARAAESRIEEEGAGGLHVRVTRTM